MSNYSGHKVFISTAGARFVVMEGVTDEVPPTRMRFMFRPDEAKDVAAELLASVVALQACVTTPCRNGRHLHCGRRAGAGAPCECVCHQQYLWGEVGQ